MRKSLVLQAVFIGICLFLLHAKETLAFSYQVTKSVGLGFVDVIPHQVVRAKNDKLYMIGGKPTVSNIMVYWMNQTGLLQNSSTFSSLTISTGTEKPISVDTSYDGNNTIVVLTNTTSGSLLAYSFDVSTNTAKPVVSLATNSAFSQNQIGTSGLSSMFDQAGKLHVAYWSSGDHITYRQYAFNASTNTFTLQGSATTVDTAGAANHPAVAISPLDSSLTVAWVSQATSPAKILTRTKTSAGAWGSIETASTANVWVSPNSGLNIDQGPSLVIGLDGIKHLAYMQDWENVNGTFDYGRIHYVRNTGSGWSDQALPVFTHDPAITITNTNEIFTLGHGHPFNVSCKSMDDMCVTARSTSGTWGNPQLFATHPSGDSFDASPSVKWSVVGFNRPETVEFLFFSSGGNYVNTTIYAGAFSQTNTTSVPSATPTATPVPTATPLFCMADINIDGIVDISDYGVLALNFQKNSFTNPRVDMNGDGIVDISDYGILASNFLKETTSCGFQ